MSALEKAAEALSYISAEERNVWVTCAFALKDEFGEDAYTVWDSWSQTGSTYNRNSAATTWRSAKAGGKTTIASLYYLARAAGWKGKAPVKKTMSLQEKEKISQERRFAEMQRGERYMRGRHRAKSIIASCRNEEHEYFCRKGFPERKGLIIDRDRLLEICPPHPDAPELPAGDPLVVPAFYKQEVVNCQLIFPEGDKRFLAGARISECYHPIGYAFSRKFVFCEGLATGLSVWTAIQEFGQSQKIRVIVCFSAYNLVKVAALINGKKRMKGFVVADNDFAKEGGRRAGLDAARQTGLPLWMPEEEGTDGNDFMNAEGVERLVREMREFLK